MKASMFLKHLFSAIVAAVKGRSAAMRTKTSAVRTRLVVFSILRNKKLLMSAISRRIHTIMSGRSHDDDSESGNGSNHLVAATGGGDGRKAAVQLQKLPSFVLLNSLPSFLMGRDGGGSNSPLVMVRSEEEREEGVAKQLQQMVNAPPRLVVDLARSAAEEPGGVEFRLEDEIDHVADVFIRRFHDQMKLQKLESFKRFCEMLERN